jgi:hypothetical protein
MPPKSSFLMMLAAEPQISHQKGCFGVAAVPPQEFFFLDVGGRAANIKKKNGLRQAQPKGLGSAQKDFATTVFIIF